MKSRTSIIAAALGLSACASQVALEAKDLQQTKVKRTVDRAILPVMKRYHIPGMAIGIVVGSKDYLFKYGVASLKSGKPVTETTLFEIGSISKTLTATLASYAQVEGKLSLKDKVSKHIPSLQGSKFGDISILHLGTHTVGGLPLKVPAQIKNNEQLFDYFKHWQPAAPPGTIRTYANPGVGLLGLIAARSMKQDFGTLMEGTLFPVLGMKDSYINVSGSQLVNYAQGYTRDDKPVRMTSGVLSSEAYGVKATASDMIRFLKANMNLTRLDKNFQRAIDDTHISYFKAGGMTQDLIWEQYSYPVNLKTLLEGNSPKMVFEAIPVKKITPAQMPRKDVWINKTGSTNGFGAYVVFVPKFEFGLVILANKNYPVKERVTVAYQILKQLEK